MRSQAATKPTPSPASSRRGKWLVPRTRAGELRRKTTLCRLQPRSPINDRQGRSCGNGPRGGPSSAVTNRPIFPAASAITKNRQSVRKNPTASLYAASASLQGDNISGCFSAGQYLPYPRLEAVSKPPFETASNSCSCATHRLRWNRQGCGRWWWSRSSTPAARNNNSNGRGSRGRRHRNNGCGNSGRDRFRCR